MDADTWRGRARGGGIITGTGGCAAAAMSFMRSMFQRASSAYRAKVGKELSAHGLLYEDALVETEEVKLALSRLPKDVFNAREQRLKRAMMLSCSHKTLPAEVAERIDPFESYLGPYLEQVQKEKEEQELLTK